MKSRPLTALALGIATLAALAWTPHAFAHTPEPAADTEAQGGAATAPMADHHKGSAEGVEWNADLMTECRAMMAKQHELHEKLSAMDLELDELLASMNSASTSGTALARDQSMAAVITELAAQRRLSRSLMMEMQPEMMAHVMHHREVKGTERPAECPAMTHEGHLQEPEPSKPVKHNHE